MRLELHRIRPGVGDRINVGMRQAETAVVGLSDLTDDHAAAISIAARMSGQRLFTLGCRLSMRGKSATAR